MGRLKSLEIAMIEKLADQVDKHLMYGVCDHKDCYSCNPDLRAREQAKKVAESNRRWRDLVDGE